MAESLYTPIIKSKIKQFCEELCDSLLFDEWISLTKEKLAIVLDRVTPDDLHYRNTKVVTEFCFPNYKTMSKELFENIDLILKTSYVLVKCYDPSISIHKLSLPEFLQKYPEAQALIDSNEKEFDYLQNYLYYFSVARTIIQTDRNKGLLVRLTSLLEGSGRTYRSGGGQSMMVTIRELIYERETGLARVKRERPKKSDLIESSSNKKIKSESVKSEPTD